MCHWRLVRQCFAAPTLDTEHWRHMVAFFNVPRFLIPMRYFDVRQSGDLASGAPWPAQPPALKVLDLPPRLQAPLATTPPSAPISQPAPGMRVSNGQRLSDPSGQTAPAILPPTTGRAVGS